MAIFPSAESSDVTLKSFSSFKRVESHTLCTAENFFFFLWDFVTTDCGSKMVCVKGKGFTAHVRNFYRT